ncbi:hypothetical protein [Nostoc sp.]|uniref:hypothetical protein n=1 Tax=Nostoc sp. TaxID=1180 RepID=UPI002FF13F48
MSLARVSVYIRERILEHVNSFGVKSEFVLQSQHLVNNSMECKLDRVHLVNYYHLKDSISDHLD